MAQTATARPLEVYQNGGGGSPSYSKPEVSEANHKHQNDEGRGTGASRASQKWLSAFEEPAIARVQQFIVETLKNPIRFIKSDYSSAQDVPFEAVNDPKVLARRKEKTKMEADVGQKVANGDKFVRGARPRFNSEDAPPQEPGSNGATPLSSPSKPAPSLFSYRISLQPFKSTKERGVGLNNRGNTCYMNSTLQALLHVPPLSHALLALDTDQLYGRFGGQPVHKFDAIGEMKSLATRALTGSKNGYDGAVTPTVFIADLKSYARTLVKYRQEDAHEFLRFLLDAMQYCCLVRAPKSLKPFDPLRETTLVHKIFGGKLRSRVQCGRCKHNSDTFDPILDLSLDIRNLRSNTLSAALENFTGTDELRGSEKYKCEKCKMSVNATKRFTIHEAPVVLTVHLKRFTLTGQKISKQIGFNEDLTLTKHVLSEGKPSHKYRLCAVVHHHGGGPNSGHYIASVRGASGNRWYEMNDSHVSPMRGAPVNSANAYILFYVRSPGSALEDVVREGKAAAVLATPSPVANGRKRRLSAGTSDGSDVEQDGYRSQKYGRLQRSTPNGHTSQVDTFAAAADDDDVGEAVGPVRAANGSYESLVSAKHGSPDRTPMSKKMRRKIRALSDQHNGQRNHESDSSPVKRSSLINSPYLAGQRKNQGGPYSPRSSPHHHNNQQQGGAFRNRMKNRQGQRTVSYH